MNYKVVYTENARQDIREIYNYISYSLFAPESAKKIIQKITGLISSLDSMPERFKLYSEDPWRNLGLHSVPVDKYVVFYLVDNVNYEVLVTRIMYGGRNIEKELND